jgi:hypothetical protein
VYDFEYQDVRLCVSKKEQITTFSPFPHPSVSGQATRGRTPQAQFVQLPSMQQQPAQKKGRDPRSEATLWY